MSRRVATPGEVSRWEQQLAPYMPHERVVAVVSMLAEVVSECPACGEAVRLCDCRRLLHERPAHLGCVR